MLELEVRREVDITFIFWRGVYNHLRAGLDALDLLNFSLCFIIEGVGGSNMNFTLVSVSHAQSLHLTTRLLQLVSLNCFNELFFYLLLHLDLCRIAQALTFQLDFVHRH